MSKTPIIDAMKAGGGWNSAWDEATEFDAVDGQVSGYGAPSRSQGRA